MKLRWIVIMTICVSLTSSWSINAQDAAAKSKSTLAEAQAIAAQLAANRKTPAQKSIETVLKTRAALNAVEVELTTLNTNQTRKRGEAAEINGKYEAALNRYSESIRALGKHPDSQTIAILTPSVQHYNPQVRLAALTALRECPANNQPILASVRALIENDTSPEIQREAFEVYCRWGNEAEVLSLAMTLGREANPLQDLGLREWIRIEKERMARANGEDRLQTQRQ